MNSQDEKNRKVRILLPEGLVSPFLEGGLFTRESGTEWEARLAALEAESQFRQAFEQSSARLIKPDKLTNEFLDKHEESQDERFSVLNNPEENDDFSENETGIIDGDDRVLITPTDVVPWRWICKIIVKDNRGAVVKEGGGTGLLISDRHVLTAAHVVYPVFKGLVNHSIEVTPALDWDKEPFGSYVVSAKPKIPINYNPKAQDHLSWDYALLTLKERVGKKLFSRLGGNPLYYWGHPTGGEKTFFQHLNPNTLYHREVWTAGYPGRKGGLRLWRAKGMIGAISGSRIYITADTTAGQSGSPVWVKEAGKRYLIGIAVGGGRIANIVVYVTDYLIKQVRLWISQDGDTPSWAVSRELPEPEVTAPQKPLSSEEVPSEAEAYDIDEELKNFENDEMENHEREGEEGLHESKEVDEDEALVQRGFQQFEEQEMGEESSNRDVGKIADRTLDDESAPGETHDELTFEAGGAGAEKSFITNKNQTFVILVAGYDYESKGDSFGAFCRNRARVIVKIKNYANSDNLVFIWFNVANGKVYVNHRKNNVWSLKHVTDWKEIKKIVFNANPATSIEFDFEAIDWKRHYYKKIEEGGWDWRFNPKVTNKVIGITDIYNFLANLGIYHPKSLIEFSVISHSHYGGPILVNSDDLRQDTEERDKTDKDGRHAKDFIARNMPSTQKNNIKNVFRNDGIIWIWGCYVNRRTRGIIQALVRSVKPTPKNYGRCVMGVEGAQYKEDGTTDPNARFRYDFKKCGFFSDLFPKPFDGTFSRIRAYVLREMMDSYFAEIANAFNKPCFAPASGTSTNHGKTDPYATRYYSNPIPDPEKPGRFKDVPVPWIEMGKPRSESMPGETGNESDFRPIIKFFVTEFRNAKYAFEVDAEGHGFIKYKPELLQP